MTASPVNDFENPLNGEYGNIDDPESF